MSEENEVVEDAVAQEPAAAPVEEKKGKQSKEVPSAYAVVGGGDTDTVYLSRCVYKNVYARKSLTVHHVQRRLAELGYTDAAADHDGWYADLTVSAVRSFQADNKLAGDGMMDAATLTALFKGDPNVTLDLEN